MRAIFLRPLETVRALFYSGLAVAGLYLLPGSFAPGSAGLVIEAVYDCDSGEALKPPESSAALNARRIDEHRFRISGKGPLCFGLRFGGGRTPRVLAVRPGPEQPEARVTVRVATSTGWLEGGASTLPASADRPAPRALISIPSEGSRPGHIQASFSLPESGAASSFVLEEVALFESRDDQRTVTRLWRGQWALDSRASTALSWLTLLGIGLLCISPLRTSRWWVAVFAISLSLSVSALAIRQHHAGRDGYDFRVVFANIDLQNSNGSESTLYGSRILAGKGNTVSDVASADSEVGTVPAYRMPGHAMFVALAGALFRTSPGDLVGLGEAAAWLQVACFVVSLAALAAAMPWIMPIPVAALLVGALCWFTHSFDQIQGDTIALYCGFLISASLCLYLHGRGANPMPPLRYHLAVHAAFGLSTLVRSDVLVGWAAVSLFMYWRSWRHLAIPLTVGAAVTGSFGAYKMAHGSRFVPTTTNVGHVAFVGLWQVPEHRFVWEPTDESYIRWIEAHGYRYFSVSANTFATREIVRFWLTFPGYTLSTFWHKLNNYLHAPFVWGGSLTASSRFNPGVLLGPYARGPLVLAVLLSLFAGYQVNRTFFLGWPLFFNLPLFCVLQGKGGRFVAFVTCSIALAAVPLLLEPGFYRAVRARAGRTMPVALIALLLWHTGPQIDAWMLASPRFRYATPLLNPADSTLNVPKRAPNEARD